MSCWPDLAFSTNMSASSPPGLTVVNFTKQIQHNDFPKPISHDRSNFKCTKLCHFYKNNWPGTNKPMCNYVEDHLRAFGYDETIEKCTNDNFDIGYYSAPG